ncbi:MAG: hypothetical protein ABSH01_23145 [Terriglobia bacterium]|jgi:hypothetical protein
MLGIPKQFLDCSVYLYKTQAHADKGEQSGGSGFLVGMPLTENPEEIQFYVVTNEHVIREMDSPTIRLNRIEGKAESHSTNLRRWISHAPSDLAIYPLEVIEEDFRLAWVPFSRLLDESKVRALEILPGGEVFMIGRFVGHDGRQRNTPSVRLDNVRVAKIRPERRLSLPTTPSGQPAPHPGSSGERFRKSTRLRAGGTSKPRSSYSFA